MNLVNYFENPEIQDVNAEKARAYFVPFKNLDEVREVSKLLQDKPQTDIRQLSDSLQFLNGDWYFQYYDNYQEVPDSFGKEACLSNVSDQTIPVPSNWQMYGFDQQQYVNTRYPFPANPPYVPDENPCGAYEYYFNVDEKRKDSKAFLNFEGVDSAFYLWLNGKFVGYSQISHNTHEFDVTSYLKSGQNLIQVLVMKWCDGSYLEDQDKFRMSGIFRDVYILYRPKTYLRDYRVKTDISDDLSEFSLKVDLAWNAEPAKDVKLELEDTRSGKILADFKAGEEIKLKDLKLWSAEEPYLYSLHIAYQGEAIRQDIGFRKVEIKGDTFYLNKQNIKLKGTNRHDADPVTGYYIKPEQLLKDLSLMKKYNINAIRTSHYPNAPWAYEYYSRFGFYVIDEADLEMHGSQMLAGRGHVNVGETTLLEVPDESYSYFANLPMFKLGIMQRIQNMVLRDKNQSAIIIWSLGNEAGYSQSLKDAALWIKDFDPSRKIQYESVIHRAPYFSSDLEEIDFVSRMYPSTEDLEKYIALDGKKKPYFLMEYMHSMGNGPGGIEDYWQIFYNNDCMSGGFAWEWADHAIFKGYKDNGQKVFFYGGDHGEKLHDGNFCVDGLIKPDRELSPSLEEYGNVLRPIRVEVDAEAAKEGKLKFYNMLDFIDVGSKYAIHFEYKLNDQLITEGTISDYSIKPRESKLIDFNLSQAEIKKLHELSEDASSDKSLYLNIYYLNKGKDFFLTEDELMGFEQIIIYEAKEVAIEAVYPDFTVNKAEAKLAVEETKSYLYINGTNFSYKFDKRKGVFAGLSYENEVIFNKAMEFNTWRAPVDNDMYIKQLWYAHGFNRCSTKLKQLSYQLKDDIFAINAHITMAPDALQPVAELELNYLLKDNGELRITADVNRNRNYPWLKGFAGYPLSAEQKQKLALAKPYLPRFGLRFFLDKSYENLAYEAYGPKQAYEDMHAASLRGKYSSKVSEQYVDYIMPQEHGSHIGSSSVILSNDLGLGLAVHAADEFSFNASHYSQEELERKQHNFELEESKYTILCLDYRMSGLGSNSCGPLTKPECRLNEEEFNFEFILEPGRFQDINKD